MKSSLRVLGLVTMVWVMAVSGMASEKWVHARTEHFDMYSAASERSSRQFLNQLEQFHAAFQKLFRLSPVGGPPVTVMMFDSDSQMEPFKPMVKNKVDSNIAGYYLPGQDEDFIVLSAEAQNQVNGDENVIFHEYVHKLLHEQGYLPPVWLDEGLAEFYSTMRVSKDSVEIGYPSQTRLERVNRSSLTPLEQLFAVTHASPEYHEEQLRHNFYAQSWLLVHYLTCGADKDVKGKFPLFLEAVNESPKDQEAKCRQVYGMDYAQMQTALRGYMTSGRFMRVMYKFNVGDFSDKIKFEPVSETERDVALENLRWRMRPDDAVSYRLLQLTEREPRTAKPYEALAAFTLENEKDRRQAVDYWEKAVEHGSASAYVYLQLAREQLNPLMAGLSLDYRIPAGKTDELRKLLDRAIELSPGYLQAWESLAQVEAFSERLRPPVINRYRMILPLMRSKANTLAALAVIGWRTGDVETCQALVGQVEKMKPDPIAKNMIRLLRQKLNPHGGAGLAQPDGT